MCNLITMITGSCIRESPSNLNEEDRELMTVNEVNDNKMLNDDNLKDQDLDQGDSRNGHSLNNTTTTEFINSTMTTV